MKQAIFLLQSYLLGRTGSRLIAVTLLLSLIWWGGPSCGLTDERTRLYLMFAVVVTALLVWGLRCCLVRRNANRFMSDIQGQGGAQKENQADIDELKRKMEQAVASLKSSGLGRKGLGNTALYALPWFLVIGPSAAGKTTLLRNSGLHFPHSLGEDVDIKGFGGTRNCDWWFSDEAVLLDTAGRYTTEDNDREEWMAFLSLLRKYRPKMPINGVLVTLSLADLLTADKSGIEKHVQIIRNRLDELNRHLGCIFPIYLVITKTDQLHGFASYFQDLTPQQTEEVWGTWLLDNPSQVDLESVFAEKISLLYRQLSRQRLSKLGAVGKLSQKYQTFNFPDQFKVATEKLRDFLHLLFKSNPYQETPRFCSVHFTSATQEGLSIQRLSDRLNSRFEFVQEDEPEAPERKTFFIKSLFDKVIFPNALAVTRNKRSARISSWCKTAWICASLSCIGITFLLLSTSLTSNTILARQGQRAVSTLVEFTQSRPNEVSMSFARLLEVQSHYDKLKDYESVLPWHLSLGIYQGGDQLSPLRSVLGHGTERLLLKPALIRLEKRLEVMGQQWPTLNSTERAQLRAAYYRDLKTYLMLCHPEHLSCDFVIPVLTEMGQFIASSSAASASLGAQQDKLLREYLSDLKRSSLSSAPWKEDKALVSLARTQLLTPPDPHSLYDQIRQGGQTQLPPQSLPELMGTNFETIFTTRQSLSGFFTQRGWNTYVRPQIQKAVNAATSGDWVLGTQKGAVPAPSTTSFPQEQREALSRRIRELYFADYSEAWFEFLRSVSYRPFTSMAESSRQMVLMARSDGPLGELMKTIAKNINLKNRPQPQGAAMQGLQADVEELDAAMDDLRKFCNPADKMNVSLLMNQYLLTLSAVQSEIDRLQASVNVPRAATRYSGEILSGSGGNLELYKSWVSTSSMLNGIETRTRKILSDLLIEPLRLVWQSILLNAEADLQSRWDMEVISGYRQKLRGRFPFRLSGQDASLADVAEFFRPQEGTLWFFVQENLRPFLSQNAKGWEQKTWLNKGARFSRELLQSLTRARQISSSLFRSSSPEPGLRFFLNPVPTKGLSEMLLAVSGDEYRYRNEPLEWRQFSWPAEREEQQSRVEGIYGNQLSKAEIRASGPWGLFRLLQQAEVTQENSRQYMAVWNMEGSNGLPVTVRFRIKTGRICNLMDKSMFKRFSLPDTLF